MGKGPQVHPNPVNTFAIAIDIAESLSFCDFFLSDFSHISIVLAIDFSVI